MRIIIAAVMGLALAGCNSTALTGTALGGLAGGVIGSQFGSGDGRLAATAIGAVVGASVGNRIALALDEDSQRAADRATNASLTTGSPIRWESPTARGRVKPTRTGRDLNGRQCREYQHEVKIGGRSEIAYGVACRGADGDWEILSPQ